MQYYIDSLPDFQPPSPEAHSPEPRRESPGPRITAATPSEQASVKEGQNSALKKAMAKEKTVVSLQEASDLHRQKFMDTFQQMSGSPAVNVQKQYKVKSEAKTVVPGVGVVRASHAEENPFSNIKRKALNPLEGLSLQQAMEANKPSFPPMGAMQSDSKLERTQSQSSQLGAKEESKAGHKIEKKLIRKKGKIVKGVTYVVSSQTPAQSTPSKEETKHSEDVLNPETSTKHAAAVKQEQKLSQSPLTRSISREPEHERKSLPAKIKDEQSHVADTALNKDGSKRATSKNQKASDKSSALKSSSHQSQSALKQAPSEASTALQPSH